jgi:hypothetical protein
LAEVSEGERASSTADGVEAMFVGSRAPLFRHSRQAVEMLTDMRDVKRGNKELIKTEGRT